MDAKIEYMQVRYSQKKDDMDNKNIYDQWIDISTEDAGGGKYYIIKTNRWAFESVDELKDIVSDFIKRLSC